MAVHRSVTAEDGLEYLRANRPDVVVVDYHLPGMQGDEFCRLPRANVALASIPLLILTEDTKSNAEQRGLDCGADDYLAKATDSDVLLARIDLLLRRLGETGIDFKDLKTSQSSLEDIFVDLVRERA